MPTAPPPQVGGGRAIAAHGSARDPARRRAGPHHCVPGHLGWAGWVVRQAGEWASGTVRSAACRAWRSAMRRLCAQHWGRRCLWVAVLKECNPFASYRAGVGAGAGAGDASNRHPPGAGSMYGARETVAKALALECMRGAHRQQRRCYLYAFRCAVRLGRCCPPHSGCPACMAWSLAPA